MQGVGVSGIFHIKSMLIPGPQLLLIPGPLPDRISTKHCGPGINLWTSNDRVLKKR